MGRITLDSLLKLNSVDTADLNKLHTLLAINANPTDITSRVNADHFASLIAAIVAQDLESYGYKLGDYFYSPNFHDLYDDEIDPEATGTLREIKFKYVLADLNTFSVSGRDPHIAIIVFVNGVKNCWTYNAATSDTVFDCYKQSHLHYRLVNNVLPAVKEDISYFLTGVITNISDATQHLLTTSRFYTDKNYSITTPAAHIVGKHPAIENSEEAISALSDTQIFGYVPASNCIDDIDNIGECSKKFNVFNKYSPSLIFNNNFWFRTIITKSWCSLFDAQFGRINTQYAQNRNISALAGYILFH